MGLVFYYYIIKKAIILYAASRQIIGIVSVDVERIYNIDVITRVFETGE
jgi:hypothetical protein